MSAGGVFKLIANDGKADKLIMATELLTQRIKNIMCLRERSGMDPTPTLADIERTHVLYVNAHYKPFAATTYEYQLTRTTNGVPSFGGQVSFNIPQFGDFLSDMVINSELESVTTIAGTIPAFPAQIGADAPIVNTTAEHSSCTNAHIGSVASAQYCTHYVYQYVDLQGNALTEGAAASNYIRYCEAPGERLFTKIKFDVNSNPLDDYTTEAMIFYDNFYVTKDKRVGWNRLIGQEVALTATSDLSTIAGQSVYPLGVSNLNNTLGVAATACPINATYSTRKTMSVLSGPQTPKATQPALDLWTPLLFWFNLDPHLAIASVCIPYGQRLITCDIAAQSDMVSVAPGNIFLRLTTEWIHSFEALPPPGGAAGTWATVGVDTYNSCVTYEPVLATGSTIVTTQRILNMVLLINNVFVNPEIHDIYIRRIGFTLIRVHRYQSIPCSSATGELLLSTFKWPIETIFIGLQPTINYSTANVNRWYDWNKFVLNTSEEMWETAKSHGECTNNDGAFAWNLVNVLGSEHHKYMDSQIAKHRYAIPIPTETITTLKLTAHSINLYDDFKLALFRDYIPWKYGGSNIVTPENQGMAMVNFCFYPGTYQPSGHINVSRAREFYVTYVSGYCSPAATCRLVAIARAINFLLISDGSAILRYST